MKPSWTKRLVATVALASFAAALLVPTAALAADGDTLESAIELENLWTTSSQTVNDSIDSGADVHDVWAVYLRVGEVLSVSFTPPAGQSTGVNIYWPYASDFSSTPLAQSIAPTGSNAMTQFKASESGYYYLDVNATSAAGGYSLTAQIVRLGTDVIITSSPYTLQLWDYPTIKGYVVDRYGSPVAGDVYLFSSNDLVNWYPVTGRTYDGVTDFALWGEDQYRKTYYMATYEGDTSYCTSSMTTKAYSTKVSLGNVKSSKSTWSKGKNYTAYGVISPKHTAGSYPVRIYKYKKVSGKWKSYGYTKAKAYDISGNYWESKYARSMSLPSAGSWRIRAYAPADSRHAGTWSSAYKYITVK